MRNCKEYGVEGVRAVLSPSQNEKVNPNCAWTPFPIEATLALRVDD